ncbi:MAG: DEAD/DEAH box helicase [Planctomycetota bacterium]|nr:DEAD/DEAH box helicase [Planctomycetota bacterium]
MPALRQYQQSAVNAIVAKARQGASVLASLPTGSGKSWIIAELCRIATGRVLVLAHVKELLVQNADKIAQLTDKPIGLYCAGLGEKDATKPVTVASVQSIVRARPEPFTAIVVDEVHRVPHKKIGQYHAVFAHSPNAKIIGLTATPYRLDGGMLTEGDDRLFDEIVYEAKTTDLIEEGWLSPIVGYRGAHEADLEGVHTKLGEFVASEMQERFQIVAEDSCRDIVAKSAGRKAVLVFCAGIEHAKTIAGILASMGEPVAYVDGTISKAERAAELDKFQSGAARFLVNIDVLTTGYDHPGIDCIAILRATKSPGLYVQMAGRGLRKADGKTDCLLLDFGGNIRRHGPLDDVRAVKTWRQDIARSKTCRSCGAEVAIYLRTCPNCLAEFQIEEREIRHCREADDADPLSSPVETWPVQSVTYSRHSKPTRPDSLRVDYYCGMGRRASEWVCPEHDGFAKSKALRWFARRGVVCRSVDEALERQGEFVVPQTVSVSRDGKWWRILSYEF